tara:strand:- start:312 stop:497 length:186 start_codon:yes stop_codon:yes gene_type:complete
MVLKTPNMPIEVKSSKSGELRKQGLPPNKTFYLLESYPEDDLTVLVKTVEKDDAQQKGNTD